MPRKKTIRQSNFPYHINARSRNREWYALPMTEVWDIFSIYLHFTKHAFNLQIHAFVLMSNHFHMIVRTPDANIDEAMNYFLREVSREIGKRTDRINQIFGGPYHRTVIDTELYYWSALKYVHNNPIFAGICKKVEDYPFGNLHGQLGRSHILIPIEADIPDIYWLNDILGEDEREAIRKALKKTEFQIKQSKNSGKKIDLRMPPQ